MYLKKSQFYLIAQMTSTFPYWTFYLESIAYPLTHVDISFLCIILSHKAV